MSIKSCLIALGVVCGLTFGASPAMAGKGTKKTPADGVQHITGTVVSVDQKAGEITVKTAHKVKKGADKAGKKGEAAEKKITVGSDTKYFAVKGKKGKTSKTASSLKAVKTGEAISLTVKGDRAESVTIHPAAKIKKK